MQFRNNVNALRAIALIAVILFHFQIYGFDGGFTGVDVFFVISGFLMTGVIFTGLRDGDFSLLAFYASRARRIIPALAVLCLGLMAFGFVYLNQGDYRELLRTIKESLLFTSNIKFAKNGSYFDAPLHENWLLHTWSLSVEWQFYMIYPIILMALNKLMGDQKTKIAVVVLFAISLAASILVTTSHPVYSFYMLPTRAWEMLCGGVVFLFPVAISGRTRTVSEVVGITLILLSTFIFTDNDLWPGYLAILPVFGTALVISANTNSAFSRNRLIQFIGKISYSVYLWHWPIVVFLYICGFLTSPLHVTTGILLSFALGTASYYFVESKVKKITNSRVTIYKYSSTVVLIVIAAAVTSWGIKAYPQIRFAYVDQGQPAYTSKLYSQECYPNEYGAADCKLNTGNIEVILFGDSHAQSTAAAVQLENNGAALSWARGGCPTLHDFEMQDAELGIKCRGFAQSKLAVLKTEYIGVPVVLFSRTALYSDNSRENSYRVYFNGNQTENSVEFGKIFATEYAKTVCAIAEQHPVYIVRPIPEMPFSVYKGLSLQARIFGKKSDISIPISNYEERNRVANYAIDYAAQLCNAKVIDPTPYLCPQGHCMGSIDGTSLYYDDNHLVDSGNVLIKELFKGLFKIKPVS